MDSVTIEQIRAARRRIAGGIYTSPCPESVALSEICGTTVFCKLEYLQRTGSFKERGARNALLLLSPQQRKRGVVAASAGNHALGLAYHGRLLYIPVTVVMPRFAPLIKVASCRRLGAEVILHGENFADARLHAEELAERDRRSYLHGFDDARVISGQGTVGLEILEQVPDAETVVVPIGGGGLIAGVSLAVKSLRPAVTIVGVEPEGAAAFTAALGAGRSTGVDVKGTLADGLAVGKVGDLCFEIARHYIDEVVTVTEDDLALAVFRLIELEKSVVEGAGAAPLAAFLSGKLRGRAPARTVLCLTGGNIDLMLLDRIIQFGMVADGRLCRFTALISDRPGGLANLARLIASTGANVKDISHDRTFSGSDMAVVRAICTVETTDRDHMKLLIDTIEKAGVGIIPHSY